MDKYFRSHENIYLFIPNIIGYARIVFALVSFYYMRTCPWTASLCYIISGGLDAFDGMAARRFNQSSKFGAMLDMLTDRMTTMCLLVCLSHFYPSLMFAFQVSMCVDIVSHWIHMQSSVMKGAESHKSIDLSGNPILKYYYTDRRVLFMMCLLNEMFYVSLYVANFTYGFIVPLGPLSFAMSSLMILITSPFALAKTAISCVQLYAACDKLTAIDRSERVKIN